MQVQYHGVEAKFPSGAALLDGSTNALKCLLRCAGWSVQVRLHACSLAQVATHGLYLPGTLRQCRAVPACCSQIASSFPPDEVWHADVPFRQCLVSTQITRVEGIMAEPSLPGQAGSEQASVIARHKKLPPLASWPKQHCWRRTPFRSESIHPQAKLSTVQMPIRPVDAVMASHPGPRDRLTVSPHSACSAIGTCTGQHCVACAPGACCPRASCTCSAC